MTYPPPTDPLGREVVEPETVTPVYPYRTIPTGHWRAIQAVWFVAGVVDVLIAIRFMLKLFGASTESPFVVLVSGVTAPLVAPFRGIFPVTGQGAFVLEPASLVALVIYALIALGAASLIRIMARRRTVAV